MLPWKHSSRMKTKGQRREREWMGDKHLLHFFDYDTKNTKYSMWGLTAGILIRAASVVYQQPPSLLKHNPKFEFPGDVTKYSMRGLTAGILIRAASVVYQQPPSFLKHNPKFEFPGDVTKDTVVA